MSAELGLRSPQNSSLGTDTPAKLSARGRLGSCCCQRGTAKNHVGSLQQGHGMWRLQGLRDKGTGRPFFYFFFMKLKHFGEYLEVLDVNLRI